MLENAALIVEHPRLDPQLPFVLAAVAFGRAMTVFDWFKKHYVAVMRAGGGMLIVIGVLLMTGVWDSWVSSLQVWVNGFTVAV